MLKFYKMKIFLFCLSVTIVNCEEVHEDAKQEVEGQILPLSRITAITEGKLERNKRGLLDHLLAELQEYFDYSGEDDSEEEEKYLICRNCTVVISQSANQNIQSANPNSAPTNMETGVTNEAAQPPNGASNGATKPETAASKPDDSPMGPPKEDA